VFEDDVVNAAVAADGSILIIAEGVLDP